MGARSVRVALATAALACAGCGSSSQTARSSQTNAARGASHATAARLPLDAFLVRGNEETGLSPGVVEVSHNAAQWTAAFSNPAAAERQAVKVRFREGLHVGTSGIGNGGASSVAVLGSASDAARYERVSEQENGWGSAPLRRWHFAIPGVPGAVGLSAGGTVDGWFIEGRCLIIIGDQFPGKNKPPVIHAAQAVWARTHGKPSVCTT